MSKLKNYAFATTVISLILAFPVRMHASTFQCNSGDASCLVAAVNQSNVNGQNNIINLKPGTYVVAGVPNAPCLPIITGTVTIHGKRPETTIITCSTIIPRLLSVSSSGNLTLHGITLNGGGVSNAGGVVNIVQSVIRQAAFAAGGAALSSLSGVVNIKSSLFANNTSTGGGALSISGGTMNIDLSRFTNNVAQLEGGAIDVFSGIVSINRSTFDHNSADFGGTMVVGGFGNPAPPALVTINDSSFTDNSAFQMGLGGAGIVIRQPTASVVVSNSTFARNSVPIGGLPPTGMAFVNFNGTLILNNSTIADNVYTLNALVVVGGIATSTGATTIIQNSILARNGSGGLNDCIGPTQSAGNNLIENPGICGITLQPTDIVGDPGLGPFVDDGSPGNGHYPLLSTSPAIGAANNAACPAEDQIGQKRQGGCDIGAIEFRLKKDSGDQLEDIIPLITKRE